MPTKTTARAHEVGELQKRFKPGYTIQHQPGGHYHVLNPEGDKVRNGKGIPISLASTPHGGRQTKNTEAALKAAGVLQNGASAPRKTSDEAAQRRKDGLKAMMTARNARREAEAKVLYDRIAPIAQKIGGMDTRGILADLAFAARELGFRQFTPDLLTGSLHRVANHGWVEPRYQEVWNALADHVEASPDPVREIFRLIRIGRGLPEDAVVQEVAALAIDNGTEWPFDVQLIELERVLVDHSYQRPVDWPWVRKTAATFDSTLVGTIDVSARGRGASFAIMDGQGRSEVLKMVGKTTVYASVYVGLDVEAEARFFLHKNQDRKAVHPFHIYKAKLAAKDPGTIEMSRIVQHYGYIVSVVSASKLDNKISAVQALDEVYHRTSDTRNECLSPTLELLKATTFGRQQGQAAMLIKGFGRFFQLFSDEQINRERLYAVVEEKGPAWLLGRSREESSSHGAQLRAFVFVLLQEHNRGLPHSQRLKMPGVGERPRR